MVKLLACGFVVIYFSWSDTNRLSYFSFRFVCLRFFLFVSFSFVFFSHCFVFVSFFLRFSLLFSLFSFRFVSFFYVFYVSQFTSTREIHAMHIDLLTL